MHAPLNTEVAIVGGGLIGASTALALRGFGVPVVLLERDTCGSRSSGINFGGVRRQGRAPAQLPFAQRAHQIWQNLPATIGIDGEYVPSGHLKLARNAADMAALEAYEARTRDFGLGLRLLSARELRAQHPWLSADLAGGSLCPADGHANPRLVAPAFARAAARAGAQVLEHTAVEHIERSGNGFALHCAGGLTVRAQVLVNSAGAWAGEIARQFGESMPVKPGHPVMAVTEPLPPCMHLSLGMEGGGMYARQVERGNVVFGGGHGYALDATRARPAHEVLLDTMRKALATVPALRHTHVIRSWSGTEAYTPDKQPVIGHSQTTPGLVHAFGFSGAGFQIAPAVGEAIAALIHRGASPVPLEPFAVTRFASVASAA
jgi:sarcosine oxidase subunit beta